MSKRADKLTAEQVINLIEKKHTNDVFIPECKNGMTWGDGKTLRLDAWVMRRSWANMAFIGYEIKVSRSDFLQDDKWRNYLEYCNQFSFVAPKGVIKPEELPEGIGLYYVASTGTRLFTKTKPVFREIDPPVELMQYALMRARDYMREDVPEKRDQNWNAQFWREWVESEGKLKGLGWDAKQRIKKLMGEEIAETKRRNSELEAENKGYAKIAAMMNEMGIEPQEWRAEERVKALLEMGLGDIKHSAEMLKSRLGDFIEAADREVSP
ncbi:MAG: MmcB family DNA repair protein [Phycisphaerales bacterium]